MVTFWRLWFLHLQIAKCSVKSVWYDAALTHVHLVPSSEVSLPMEVLFAKWKWPTTKIGLAITLCVSSKWRRFLHSTGRWHWKTVISKNLGSVDGGSVCVRENKGVVEGLRWGSGHPPKMREWASAWQPLYSTSLDQGVSYLESGSIWDDLPLHRLKACACKKNTDKFFLIPLNIDVVQ